MLLSQRMRALDRAGLRTRRLTNDALETLLRLMRGDVTGRDVVAVHQQTDELAHGCQLRLAGLLSIEVTQRHDSDIGVVVILDMGALVSQRPSLPHATGPVHDEVIADVAPTSTSMPLHFFQESLRF